MQPTFLPWLGYFGLIKKVDLFVFLDSVQFDSRSWQQRNRILINGKPHWVTVPVTCPNGKSTIMKDVLINFEHYSGSKIISSIRQSYSGTTGIKDLSDSLFDLLVNPPNHLSLLNIKLIEIISEKLEIKTEFVNSSELNVKGVKADLLLEICKNLGATEYISPPGSRDYLIDYKGFQSFGINLNYFEFKHPIYWQKSDEFFSNLSIIDSICNQGVKKTQEFILEGSRS